jgi:hypothetical protein
VRRPRAFAVKRYYTELPEAGVVPILIEDSRCGDILTHFPFPPFDDDFSLPTRGAFLFIACMVMG